MEDLNGFKKIGNYELSTICLKSYPCQHVVKLKNGDTRLMRSDNIYRLFKSEGLSDPHIDMYAEWVRQCDYLSSKEIMNREHNILKIQQDEKQRAKEKDEQQK